MATNTLGGIIAEIKADVGRIGNKIARGVTQIALQDLQEAHSSIMNDFYAGYSPVSSYYYWWQDPDGTVFSGISHGYRRTGNLKNTVVSKSVAGSGEHSFSAIINIGSDNMSDYRNPTKRKPDHTFPASAVFDLMWNQSIRGLPPGNVGHIEKFSIDTAPVGVWISGSPDQAMLEFINTWGNQRGGMVADQVAFGI